MSNVGKGPGPHGGGHHGGHHHGGHHGGHHHGGRRGGWGGGGWWGGVEYVAIWDVIGTAADGSWRVYFSGGHGDATAIAHEYAARHPNYAWAVAER